MKLIFTKSNLPLSGFIRWGLKEPVSHFAIVFDHKIVFHSNLLGTQIAWYNEFIKHTEVVFCLDYNLELEVEEAVYQSILNKNIGKSYDYPAFFYFIWRGILKRFFNIPIPNENKWAKDGRFLCTGLAATLPVELFPALKDIKDTEILSPYQLYLRLTNG